MQNILVTGGAGYIGSHACKALKKTGFIPVTYDNLSTGHAYAVKWGPFVHADLNDKEALKKAFLQYKPIGVLHFAANALVIESMMHPGKYYQNNVGSSVSLLECMKEHQVPYLIFSSTCATYGKAKTSLITESHSQEPVNPYGRSKLMIEQIIADFEMAHGIKSITLRYFNAAGADVDAEIGENHTPETHIIPSIIQAAQGLREEIVVYGTDFPSSDGSAVRDYIHVQDLADAHVKALQYLLTSKTSNVVNLGTAKGYSVLEIISAIQTFCHKKIPVRFEKRRDGEPAILVADNAKARQLLGWIPQVSDLNMLIQSAWNWHESLIPKKI